MIKESCFLLKIGEKKSVLVINVFHVKHVQQTVFENDCPRLALTKVSRETRGAEQMFLRNYLDQLFGGAARNMGRDWRQLKVSRETIVRCCRKMFHVKQFPQPLVFDGFDPPLGS